MAMANSYFDALVKDVLKEHGRIVAQLQREINSLRSQPSFEAESDGHRVSLTMQNKCEASSLHDRDDQASLNSQGELIKHETLSEPNLGLRNKVEEGLIHGQRSPRREHGHSRHVLGYVSSECESQEQFQGGTTSRKMPLHPFHPHKLRRSVVPNVMTPRLSIRSVDVGSSWRKRIMHRMESTQFELVLVALIMLNTVAMACEIQYTGSAIGNRIGYPGYQRAPKDVIPVAETAFVAIERTFVVAFTAELAFRMFIFRCRFWKHPYNYLDFAVVAAGLLDWLAESALDAKMMRLLRLCKVARGLRALRSVSSLDSLQLIIKSISASMTTLMWSLIVLAIIQCISGMIISQLLNSYFDDAHNKEPAEVQEVFSYYGTFSRSMVTMFEVTLANWAQPCRVLLNQAGEAYGFAILCYKCICGFAVLNVIAAVFIQQTMRVMQNDTDIMLMEKHRAETNYDKKLRKLFNMLDMSQDGYITQEELDRMIDDPQVKLQAYFLGIDTNDIHDMFYLVESPDGMKVEEFILAVGGIRKQAKTIDIAHILGHVKYIQYKVRHLEKQSSANLEIMTKLATGSSNMAPWRTHITQDTSSPFNHADSNGSLRAEGRASTFGKPLGFCHGIEL